MDRIVFVSDRSCSEALPVLPSLGFEAVPVPLSPAAVSRFLQDGSTSPQEVVAMVVDAEESPDVGFSVLRSVSDAGRAIPVAVLLLPDELERRSWEEVADEFLYPNDPAPALAARLRMLAGRRLRSRSSALSYGPLSIEPETYRVLSDGNLLDLTYKEFQLLLFLAKRPGRVFTRHELLRAVWGYEFYGGTRTVDVHVRRLRAKLGPEWEDLIDTVRGVGYGLRPID